MNNRLGKKMENKTYEKKIKTELYNDHFENAKRYNIPRAQLIISGHSIQFRVITPMQATLHGTLTATTTTANQTKAGKPFFKTDDHFPILRTSLTFAQGY